MANSASMPDQEMVAENPYIALQQGSELYFHLFGRIRIGQANSPGHAEHMGIHRNLGIPEGCHQHNARSLLSHAGQYPQGLDELLKQ